MGLEIDFKFVWVVVDMEVNVVGEGDVVLIL